MIPPTVLCCAPDSLRRRASARSIWRPGWFQRRGPTTCRICLRELSTDRQGVSTPRHKRLGIIRPECAEPVKPIQPNSDYAEGSAKPRIQDLPDRVGFALQFVSLTIQSYRAVFM